MPEHWTFILLGACLILVLGLFYYYTNRQIQSVQNAQQSLTNHVLYQQKVLDKHDQLFSQTLGVPRSFPASGPDPPVISVPPGVSMEGCGGADAATAAIPSVASLGPMVGTILNMFQHMQPPVDGDGDDDDDDEEVVPVEPLLSREDLQKELSKELEELELSPSPSLSPLPVPPPSSPIRVKRKEGRVEEGDEPTDPVAAT